MSTDDETPTPAEYLAFRTVSTPIGDILLAATAVGIVRVGLPTEHPHLVTTEVAQRLGVPVRETSSLLDTAQTQLEEYFVGERLRFSLPLDWRFSDGFDLRVHQQLRHIPYGTTCSYKEVAEAIGNPHAMRAVGASCGANPLPILVPCHRVIRANGDLGGYRGGLPTKVALLTLEKQMRAQGEQAP